MALGLKTDSNCPTTFVANQSHFTVINRKCHLTFAKVGWCLVMEDSISEANGGLVIQCM
jgi:hypothetical protein